MSIGALESQSMGDGLKNVDAISKGRKVKAVEYQSEIT